MSFDLSGLNEQQLAPVLNTEGAVLVTAGAGSGKTRLLTHRIAHLIRNRNVSPYNILAITFTNKAAGEMKERLERMLGGDSHGLWVFTFHALCVRILRKFITNLGGYSANFSIYGEDEKEHLIKRILKEMEVDSENNKSVIEQISDAKSHDLSPSEYLDQNSWRDGAEIAAQAYVRYEEELKKANSLDYDDLLNKAYKLLRNDREAREFFQNKFWYIHVDEFQDTNTVQYNIVKILAAHHGNILVVGDEDQSIYGWRGANFKNIFDFKKDFNCKVYKLEQNYRSTKKILQLANKIIAKNKSRLDKKLWTDNEEGTEVKFFPASSDREEADFVLSTIRRLHDDEGCSYSDCAILMRINALSRLFEERFIQYGIPHKVYGGFKFYDRKEVKDLLAYLKIIGNHNDNEAILRVINFPKRGIGDGTVAQIVRYANEHGQSLYDTLYTLQDNTQLSAQVVKKASVFSMILQCMDNAYKKGLPLFDLTCYIIKLIGLREYYDDDSAENEMRKANIRELAHSIEQFQNANPDLGLDEYLQQISLYSDLDEMDESDCVTIATVHSAKGLEFKNVFVVGMEEGIFPSSMATNNGGDDEIEEERRLMYVAVTRAEKRLYLSMARMRFRFGEQQFNPPSCFLREGGFVVDEPRNKNPYDEYEEGGRGDYGGYRRRQNRAYYGSDDDANLSGATREYKLTFAPKPAAKPTVNTAQKDLSKYVVGARVKHKKFGEGTILSVNDGVNPSAEVAFDGIGKLLLILTFAPLEVIE